MTLELRILGPIEAVRDGEPVDLGTAKERALMALLALNANRVVSAEHLADDLWGGEPPAQAATTLRVYVSHLRKALAGIDGESEGVIKTRRPGYLLELPGSAIDASQFDEACARARMAASAGDNRRAAALYREALDLWRGRALADVADQAFARSEAVRLEEARLAALEDLIAADLALGRHAELVGELDALTKGHPLRERLWAHRITALYRSGRQADALAAYRELRERLVDELGIDPSAELQELERKILAQDPSLPSGVPRPPEPQIHLPTYRTAFFGRENEIASLARDLQDHQLVTVTGVGGCGKTRLAVEVASRLADQFPDGVFFVDLGAISDPDVVPNVVSTTLGMASGGMAGGSPRPILTEISDRLRGCAALALLDNCEHLLDASAEVAETILESSPGIRVIASSREALGIEGERVLTVPSLGLPDERGPLEADSVRLFVDRASAARADFQLDSDNVEAVVDICQRLDGIPLAIELAAARVTHLSPRQIADRLSDRFRLLTGGRRRIQRQQTLQAALDWSYELLPQDERTLLRRLAVFPSDFSLEAAENVAGWDLSALTLDLLGSLVSKSLLGTVVSADGVVRYRLAETLRLYAEERLAEAGESDAIRARHLDYYRSWVDALPDEVSAFNPYSVGMSLEYQNIQEALKWAELTGDMEAVAAILARTRMQWWFFGWWTTEQSSLFERALAIGDRIENADRVSLMMQYASTLFFQGNLTSSVEYAQRAVELGRDEDGYRMVEALFTYASLIARSDRQAADALLDRAARIAEGLGPIALASLDVQRAEASMSAGEFDRARRLYASAEELPAQFYMSHWGRFGKAIVLHLIGEHVEALKASEVAMTKVITFPDLVAGSFLILWTNLARALALTGAERIEEAKAILVNLLEIVRQTRVPGGAEAILMACAAIACRTGSFEQASRLLARSVPGMSTHSCVAVFRHYAHLVHDALGSERARECRAEGAAMSLDEAFRLAGL